MLSSIFKAVSCPLFSAIFYFEFVRAKCFDGMLGIFRKWAHLINAIKNHPYINNIWQTIYYFTIFGMERHRRLTD